MAARAFPAIIKDMKHSALPRDENPRAAHRHPDPRMPPTNSDWRAVRATTFGGRIWAGALLLALMPAACTHPRSIDHRHLTLQIKLDASAWTQAHRVRWPGEHRYLSFHAGPQVVQPPCAAQPIVIAANPRQPRVRLGLVCGEPAVIFSGLDVVGITDPRDILFVAHHEAFHLLVERMGSRMRVAAHRRGEETQAIRRFWNQLDKARPAPDAGSRASQCARMEAAFLTLSSAERAHIDAISHVE